MNNIFILGPVASGKNTLLDNIAKDNEVIALDTGRIFRYVAYKLYRKLNTKINFDAVYKSNEQAIKLLIENIYHLTKYINLQLEKLRFDGYEILENNEILDINCLYGKYVNCILPLISKVQTIRNMIISFIDRSISASNKPIIMTGHNIKEIDTTKFTVVYLDVDEKESAYRLYQRNKCSYNDILDAYDEVLKRNQIDKIKETKNILPFLYDYVYINTNNKTSMEIYEEFMAQIKINKEKNNHFCSIQSSAIARNDFEWILNPILEPIRSRLTELTKSVCLKYPYINQNDLIYQTLILISSHSISDLYSNFDLEYYDKVDESIITRNQMLFNDFIFKVNCGVIRINEDIILESLDLAIKTLLDLYSSDFLKNIMIKYNRKMNRGHLETHNGLMIMNNEENSDIIIFREIDSSMSTFLSKYCHYLHAPRSDELVAYGAFIEDEYYPIAFVSFSKQDRDYKKQLLYNIGIEPQNSVEMTRAWCSNSAPRNIMSSLFQYSIEELSKKWMEESKLGLVDKKLQAVTTAINPNLGFKASSFLGCNFIPIALRPAQFTFKENNGTISYETRRKIESSCSNDFFYENQINILPLNELILCLDRNKIERIINSKILLIDKEDYDRVLSGKKLVRKKESK